VARARGIVGSIAEGAASLLGRLAQWFRLGTFGAATPPVEPIAGRERLRTPQEITAELARLRMLPLAAEGKRQSFSYVATWTDADTGERVGASRTQIDATEGTNRSTIRSRARRYFQAHIPGASDTSPGNVRGAIAEGRTIVMSVRQIGQPLNIPTGE
jgi:hypothetical protein